MPVEFTHHAKRKFLILAELGLTLSEEQVTAACEEPDRIDLGWRGRLIALKRLDADHDLRVVYEVRGDIKVIITFYPTRTERYEGRI